jgi:hypothetical protein
VGIAGVIDRDAAWSLAGHVQEFFPV